MNYRNSLKLATLLKATISLIVLTGCGSSTPSGTAASHMYTPQWSSVDENFQGYINGYPVTAHGTTTPGITVTLPSGFVPVSLAYGPTGKLYVGGAYGSSFGQILVYAPGATGNAQPIASFTGGAPGTFTFPYYLAVNRAGNLYVDSTDATLEVFDSQAQSGDLPTQYITTLATNNSYSYGIGADGAGNLYATDYVNQTIDVFAPGATGNATPIRTITGTTTNSFANVYAITADDEGNIFLANYNPSDDPYEFHRFSSALSSWHSRFTTPGSHPLLSNPRPNNSSNSMPAAATGIYEFAAGSTGNAAPKLFLSGSATGVNEPEDLQVDGVDNIYYIDFAGGSPTANMFQAGSTGNAAPTTSLTSASLAPIMAPIELAVR